MSVKAHVRRLREVLHNPPASFLTPEDFESFVGPNSTVMLQRRALLLARQELSRQVEHAKKLVAEKKQGESEPEDQTQTENDEKPHDEQDSTDKDLAVQENGVDKKDHAPTDNELQDVERAVARIDELLDGAAIRQRHYNMRMRGEMDYNKYKPLWEKMSELQVPISRDLSLYYPLIDPFCEDDSEESFVPQCEFFLFSLFPLFLLVITCTFSSTLFEIFLLLLSQ